jgi:NAD-reducing hydrogenase large subunit
MKFPFIRSLGPEDGWYRVGPLARMNTVDRIDTPLAEAARTELRASPTAVSPMPFLANHWARMIEVVHCVEKIRELSARPGSAGHRPACRRASGAAKGSA